MAPTSSPSNRGIVEVGTDWGGVELLTRTTGRYLLVIGVDYDRLLCAFREPSPDAIRTRHRRRRDLDDGRTPAPHAGRVRHRPPWLPRSLRTLTVLHSRSVAVLEGHAVVQK